MSHFDDAFPPISARVDAAFFDAFSLSARSLELTMSSANSNNCFGLHVFDKSYDITLIGDICIFRTPQLPQFVKDGIVFGDLGVTLDDHTEILTRLMEAKTDDEARADLQEYDAKLKEDYVCVNIYPNYSSSLVGCDIKGFSLEERAYVDITTLYK